MFTRGESGMLWYLDRWVQAAETEHLNWYAQQCSALVVAAPQTIPFPLNKSERMVPVC